MRAKSFDTLDFRGDMDRAFRSFGVAMDTYASLRCGRVVDYLFPEVGLAVNLVSIGGYSYDRDYLRRASLSGYADGLCVVHLTEYDWWRNRDALIDFVRGKVTGGSGKRVVRANHLRAFEVPKDEYMRFFRKNSFANSNRRIVHRCFVLGNWDAAMAVTDPRGKGGWRSNIVGFATNRSRKVIGAYGKLAAFASDRTQTELMQRVEIRLCDMRDDLMRRTGMVFVKDELPQEVAFRRVVCPETGRLEVKRIDLGRIDADVMVSNARGGSLDPSLSLRENVEAEGYCVMYDAGALVFRTDRRKKFN